MNHRLWIAFSLLLVAALACGLPSAADPTPIPLVPTPLAPAEIQPLPLPITQAPAVTAAPAIFRDDFNGTLGAGWEWIGEDTGTWSLTAAPGYMRLPAGQSNINDGQPRNFLVRAPPLRDFEISTLVRFTPTARFQIAGLLVYESQGNAMQFGPAYAPCAGGSEGQCVYFDNYQGGQFVEPNFGTNVGGVILSYLKLRRAGGAYTASYSLDGSTWKEIGTHQSSIVPQYVGLVAAQGYNGVESADFDFFTLEAVP
jgi:beta-xylosidase